MATAKQELISLIEQQPDESSYEELVRELAFSLMVRRGLGDSDKGHMISSVELGRRILAWPR